MYTTTSASSAQMSGLGTSNRYSISEPWWTRPSIDTSGLRNQLWFTVKTHALHALLPSRNKTIVSASSGPLKISFILNVFSDPSFRFRSIFTLPQLVNQIKIRIVWNSNVVHGICAQYGLR